MNGPRVTPAEFIAALEARGITLRATCAGDLLVRPASLLTDADREVLRRCKAGVLVALMGDAEVV